MPEFTADRELIMDGNSPQLVCTIDWLCANHLPVLRPSKIHLKIGSLNFCPGTGTIYFDGSTREEERGLSGLKKVLERALGRSLLPIETLEHSRRESL